MPSNPPITTRYTVTLAPHQTYRSVDGASIRSEESPNTMQSLPSDDDDEEQMTGVEADEDLIAVSLLTEEDPSHYPHDQTDGSASGPQVGNYGGIGYPGYEDQMITTAWEQHRFSTQAAETNGQAATYGIRQEAYSIVSHGHRRSETPALQAKRMERKEVRKQRDPTTAREQTVKDLKHIVEEQKSQLERLFAQNTQLTEQNNRIAMQFASRPREAALEERMYAIAEELNRERNQRQVDFEDAEKKRNEDIAKLQAENEQKLRAVMLQNDEKLRKAQQDAETKIKAMQAERDDHVASMAAKVRHTIRHVSKPRESSPVALRSRKSPTPALYESDEAMEQDVEGSDDQRSTPSRLREAVERIKATPKPKSKLRIVEKSPAIKAKSMYQTPKTKLTVKKIPQCNSQACKSPEPAVHEPTALEQKVDKLAELVYKLCEQSPTDSPRSKSARRRSGMKKEVEEEKVEMHPEWHKYYLSAVRATFGAVFGTGGTKEFYCHESAEPEDVEAFIDEEGVGPVVKDLHFDMNAGKTSRWNQHAFSLLLEVLKSVIAEDDDQPSDTYLIGLIQNRFIRCRDVWRTAQAKPKEDGSVETADEVANRLIEQNSQMNAYRRQNTRRINRFQRRDKICTKKIEYYEEMTDDDGQLMLWQQAKRIIGELGVEGMSSDESSPEDGTAGKLRVKNMPWRRNVFNLLEAVDGERVIDEELYSKRGSKPLPRVRKRFYPSSRRDPVCGLQESLYDDEWLGQQEKEFVAMKLRPRPDEEDFETLEIEVE